MDTILRTLATFGVFAAMLVSGPLLAAPINCATAKRADEVAVCTIPGMAEVDRNVDAMFQRLMSVLDAPGRAEWQKSQREFIADRRNCGRETDCIRLTYRARSQELRAALREYGIKV
jgi:uncharacterized protein